MKCSKQIENLLQGARAKTGPDVDNRILTDAKNALAGVAPNSQQTLQTKSILWRYIMENIKSKKSVAAIIILTTTLVLFNPFGKSSSNGVIWAKVVDNIDKTQMVLHKEDRSYYELGEEEPFLITNVKKYISPKYGVVEEQYTTEGDLMHRACVLGLPEEKEIIGILPGQKKYFKAPMSDGAAQLINRLTPRGLVDYFIEMEHKKLGRKKIDGHEVEGFEVIDKKCWPIDDKYSFLFPVNQITWRFWVDIENSLPVQAEYEVITDRGLLTGLKKLKIVCLAYDFEYKQEIQDELFDPRIPDDYTEFKLSDLIPAEAKAGVAGLGIIPIGVVCWKRRKKRKTLVR